MSAGGKREEIRIGRNYCISVDDPGESLRLLSRLLARGSAAACTLVTTIHPRKVAEDHGLQGVETIWVSDEPSKEIRSVQPSRMKFELTKDLLGFIANRENGVVFLEGIEYLVQVNGFDAVLAFAKQIADKAGARGHSLIVTLNSRSLPEQQLVLFRGRFDRSGAAGEFRAPGESASEDDLLGGAFQFPVRAGSAPAALVAGTKPDATGPRDPVASLTTASEPAPDQPAGGREPSGVAGLDQLIDGGIPGGAAVLLQGPSGQERDLFAAQFAIEGLRRGQQVAVTLSNLGPDEFRHRLQALGCDPSTHESAGRLKLVDWYSHRDQRVLGIEERGGVTVVSKGLTNLEIAVSKIMRQFQGRASRFLVDFLTPAIFAQGFESSKKLAETLRVKFGRQGITSLFVLDKGTHDAHQASALQQVFDGVFDIEQEKVGNVVERKAAVLSMRRTFVRTEYFPLDVVRGKGVSLRVIVVEPRPTESAEGWAEGASLVASTGAEGTPPPVRADIAPGPRAETRPTGPTAGSVEHEPVPDREEDEMPVALPQVPQATEDTSRSVPAESGRPTAAGEGVASARSPMGEGATSAVRVEPSPTTAEQNTLISTAAIGTTPAATTLPARTGDSAPSIAEPQAAAAPATAEPAPERDSPTASPETTRPASAPCPTCAGPMSYVPQYKAWWCPRCQKYGALADPRHAAALCPRCRTQMTYDAARKSWYCQGCSVYPYESPARGATTPNPLETAGQPPDGNKPLAAVDAAADWVERSGQKVLGVLDGDEAAPPRAAASAATAPAAPVPAAEPSSTAQSGTRPGTATTPDAGGTAPACPECRGPLSYVPEYRAWYCYRCQKYGAVAYQ